jgi:hypothetical protein
MKIKSGVHLRVVRSWIQRRARNGEAVTWGSNNILELPGIAVLDLEWLAQDIRDAMIKELAENLVFPVCDEFKPDFTAKTINSNVCSRCGHNRYMHDLFSK